jgi:hypothetical protein
MEKYAPSRDWHIDQMTQVLRTAGNAVNSGDIVASFISLISNMPDFQFYTMNELVRLIRDDVTQQPLVQVAAWCLGEFGDQYSSNQSEISTEDHLSEDQIVSILIKVLDYNAGHGQTVNMATREYAINALAKLSTRFETPAIRARVKSVMSVYGCNMNLELQQRAVEYNSILKNYDNLRDGLFEQMPAVELKAVYPDDEEVEEGEEENDENLKLYKLNENIAWIEKIFRIAKQEIKNSIPIFLGGDHALSAGSVSGVSAFAKEVNRPQFVLWLDAHPDIHTLHSSSSGNLHGTPVAYFTGQPGFEFFPYLEAPVPTENILMLGLRSVDSEERNTLKELSMNTVDMRNIDEWGIKTPLGKCLRHIKKVNGMLHL